MAHRLEGKIAIVTGAGSIGPGWGNGKATAVQFAREGAQVVAFDISAEAAAETARIVIGEGGSCVPVQGDISKEADVTRLTEFSTEKFGRIDILHNNVGIVIPGGILQTTEEDWRRALDINLTGIFLACRAVLPAMERQRSGVILNVSSVAATRYSGLNYVSYYTTKGALLPFTRSVALEYAKKGIRANTILPGMMDTPLIYHSLAETYSKGDIDEMRRIRNSQCPMGRMGTGWDIAHAAAFLASDEAQYITGTELLVDGGLTAKFA